MDTQKTRYLIIIRLSGDQLAQRIRASAPAVKTIIDAHSGQDCQLAFTSRDGSTYGWFLNTATPPRLIHRELFGEHTRSGTSALLNQDELLILELGRNFDGRGLSRAWTWLQHH